MKRLCLIVCCALSLFAAIGVHAQELIEPYAGGGSAYGEGGLATAAQMNSNYFIALDGSGNLFIADNGNNRVRRIDAVTHLISTVAGIAGTGGYTADAVAATTSKLNSPIGIAVDASGNIFVGDQNNNRIRRIDGSTGIITTIAGNGTAGFSADGSVAVSAMINQPRGVAVNSAGDVYFSEGGFTATRVRVVSGTTGIMSTIAGNGTAGYLADGVLANTTEINNPRGVYVDALNNVYIADMGNNRIRRVDATTGFISTVAGTGTGGAGTDGVAATTSKINAPSDVKFDAAGNMYIADVNNGRIRMVNSTGIISTVAGNSTGASAGDWGPATAAAVRMAAPVSMAILPNNNYFYISDRTNSRIREVRPNSLPVFVDGSTASLTVCENSAATSISSLLAIQDSDQLQTETWTVTASATHGAVAIGATGVANGGTVTPGTGYTYTPTIGYSGSDAFTVQVSDGYNTASITINVTVNPLPVVAAIGGGVSPICVGWSFLVSESTPGGSWNTTTGNASITGLTVLGVSAGPDVLSYTVTNACGSTSVTFPVTVNPLPDAGTISGSTSSVCATTSITLTDASAGGSWSNTTGHAAVTGGTVTGSTAGSDIISYTVINSCGTAYASYPVTVNPLPNAGTITGSTATVCQTATIVLADGAAGGSWSALNTNAAVVSGSVTGSVAGSDVISYTVINSCGTANATYPITISPSPNAGTITGFGSVCVGGNTTLTDATGSGSWTNTTGNAAVTGGTVTGVVAGADLISYSVTNSCGTAVATFTMNVVSTPDAGTITGSSTTVCQGANLALSNTTPSGVWSSANTNANVSSASGLVTGITAGADVITYTVSLSCGTAFTTYAITINPLPVPATISGAGVVCAGGSTVLSDGTTGGVWSAANITAGVSTFGVVTGITAGVDTILYSVTNGCGTVAATKTVTVNANVIPFVSFTAAPGFTTCPGTLVTYSASAVNGGTAPTYVWRVNGVLAGTGAAFVHTPVAGDAVSVTMSSSLACLVTPSAADTVAVVVNPTLIPAVSISTGIVGDTVCVGTPTTYTATPVNGGTSPTYQWLVNGTAAGTGNPFTYTPADGDVITSNLTSSYACPSPGTVTSNTITMRVNTTEVPSVTITASPGSLVCAGTVVTFTAHSVYGGLPPFFRWTQNSVNVATGPTYSYVPTTGDEVYCMMASSSSCRTLDSVFSNTAVISAQPDLPISVSIHALHGTVASAGVNDTLVAVVVTSVVSPTYQWYVNGSPVAGAVYPTYIVNATSSGTELVNCVVTSGDVCNTTVVSNDLSITINGVSGVNQVSAANNMIAIAPNPNKGSFTMNIQSDNNEDVQVEITNILGAKVKAFTATTNKEMNVTLDQPAGIYFISAITSQGRNVMRVVVE